MIFFFDPSIQILVCTVDDKPAPILMETIVAHKWRTNGLMLLPRAPRQAVEAFKPIVNAFRSVLEKRVCK